MIRRLALVALAGCLARPAQPLVAQMEHAHSAHALAEVGRVRFPTSCSAAAQPSFERGVALLHNFWFDRAAAAFHEAAGADTSCAMAWWGVASTSLHPLWAPPTPAELRAGADAVARARSLDARTDRERAWIAAIGAFFDSSAALAHAARLRAWEQALGRVQRDNPADTEAAVFHALALIAVQPKTDTAYAQLKQAAAILEPLFAVQPHHPGLAHYLIHAYDAPPLVARAGRAAARYAVIAPDAPHALHMPSHTYSLLGMWDQSIATNARSMQASRHAGNVWYEQLHAADYMVYAYLQEGRDRDALRLVRWAADSVLPAGNATAEFAVAAIPARYALERGDWHGAASLTLRSEVGNVIARSVVAFSRTIGAARSGELAAGGAEEAAFGPLEAAAAAQPDPFAPTMIRINHLAAAAWLSLAAGDTAGAVRGATAAADLEDQALKNPLTPGPLLSARELLGDMLLAVGRPADAEAAYAAALARTPRRLRCLSGALRAASLAGDTAATQRYRRELRGLMARADRGRRELSLAGP